MNQTETLSGTVEKLLFHNTENGYTVFVLQHTKNSTTIATGYVPAIHAGQHVTISGSWIMHPKFGKQFEVKQCTSQAPTSIVGLKKYLASGLIKGIGPVYAEKLVNHFGTTVLEIIDTQPHRLHEVPGIGEKRANVIITAWQDQREISHIMVFLQDKGISTAYAVKIYKKYRNKAIELLTENPYRLADDIWGIGFKIADAIAQNMGFEHNSVKRIRSGLLFSLSDIVNKGHLYSELELLKQNTIELLDLTQEDVTSKIKTALHDLYNTEKIQLVTHDEKHWVSLSAYYYSEYGVAQKIKNLLKYPTHHAFDINATREQLTNPNKTTITLNDDQIQGILTCLRSKVTIITGGPGTGKTTLIKALLNILEESRVQYKLAAPTGRAAKRIQESTHRHGQTIHRLLDFDVSTMGFKHNEQNALKVDFLIIDEASMIDIFLAHAILKALPFNAHLILLGDVDQLPSVGAGNFLSDCLASDTIAHVRLTHIFRQAQGSLIIINAHKINNGEFPVSYLPDARRDFLFIKENEPTNVTAHLKHIIANGLPKFGIPADQSIVLVPMNRGIVGTHTLNTELQTILNGQDQPYIMHAGTTFKLNDRVMQIRNNYDKLVFNGDTGTIAEINNEDKIITVNYLDRPVEYEYSELDELVLAYAISIHKSQGSEYPAVIIPIFMQHFTLLQRNLIYTAITRAKKLCIFIGQPKAIAMAIKNNKGSERCTLLKQFLTSDLKSR